MQRERGNRSKKCRKCRRKFGVIIFGLIRGADKMGGVGMDGERVINNVHTSQIKAIYSDLPFPRVVELMQHRRFCEESGACCCSQAYIARATRDEKVHLKMSAMKPDISRSCTGIGE